MNAVSNVSKKWSADVVLGKQSRKITRKTEKIIVIGASTGGMEALKEILQRLPSCAPAIILCQHMPATFSPTFVQLLGDCCAMKVLLAYDTQLLVAGHVYIAPGGQHLLLQRINHQYFFRLQTGPAVNRHKPSVDVLLRSVSQSAGENAIGVILSGMGDDGAQGMQEMHNSGALTIAQDEQSSIVWGMPARAIQCNAIDYILSADLIAQKLLDLCIIEQSIL